MNHAPQLIVVPETSSTMVLARELVRAGELESGGAVLARHQTAGRGRLDRAWVNRSDSALMMTAYRESEIERETLGLIAIATGVAVAEVISSFGRDVRLKWPNDLMINDRKLGGILISTSHVESQMQIYAGIGINIEHPGPDLETATSLKHECGLTPALEQFACDILVAWNHWLTQVETHQGPAIVSAWHARAAWIDERVTVEADVNHVGLMRGINESGHLILKTDDATIVLSSAEIVRGPRRTA